MGREVRRVPPNWEHPRDERGDFQPMHDKSFAEAARRWKAGLAEWESGADPARADHPDREWWEWESNPPDRKYYRPEWRDEERTHYQMYEDVSEGTPISPVFATAEELAHWLADNKANAGAGRTATYEQWLRVCKGGWAPSFVYGPETGLISGVELPDKK